MSGKKLSSESYKILGESRGKNSIGNPMALQRDGEKPLEPEIESTATVAIEENGKLTSVKAPGDIAGKYIVL